MANKQAIKRTGLEQIQEDADSPSVTIEQKRNVSGASKLHSELSEMADSFRMSGFKCVHEQCGLVHNHDTTKHRASDSFDMGDDEAAQMESNPNCHCGLNELARTNYDGAPSPSSANNTAPIPDSMSRHIDNSI